jgi:hypothetical protein
MSAKKDDKRMGYNPLAPRGLDALIPDSEQKEELPQPENKALPDNKDKSVNIDNIGKSDITVTTDKTDNIALSDKAILQNNTINPSLSGNTELSLNTGKAVSPRKAIEKSAPRKSIKPVEPVQVEPDLTTRKGVPYGYERHTYVVRRDLVDKIEAKAYWDRTLMQRVLEEALEQYFDGINVRPLPKEAQKPRVARPRKQN